MLDRWRSDHVRAYEYRGHGNTISVDVVGGDTQYGVVSGIHGDEGKCIDVVGKTLDARAVLHPALYTGHVRILRANPDALAHRTRTDSRGADLNRVFMITRPIQHPQAQLLARAVGDHPKMHTIFSFHEDLDYAREFYFYNTSKHKHLDTRTSWFTNLRRKFLQTVKHQGFALYSGQDDPTLKYSVQDGFCDAPATGRFDHTFEMYVARKGVHPGLQRVVLFEIPGRASIERKRDLITMTFRHFIEPYLEKMRKLTN